MSPRRDVGGRPRPRPAAPATVLAAVIALLVLHAAVPAAHASRAGGPASSHRGSGSTVTSATTGAARPTAPSPRPAGASRGSTVLAGGRRARPRAPSPAARRWAVPGKAYVALGDSYSSGPGLAPTREPGCGRSAANWASDLAAAFGLGTERRGRWADYSCAGATAAPAPGGAVTVLDQIRWATGDGALARGTRAITFTAGGNDPWGTSGRGSLYDALASCVRAGTPCGPGRRVGPLARLLPEALTGLLPSGVTGLVSAVLAGADEAGRHLSPADITAAGMVDRLRPAVAQLRGRAPAATIAVVGYPRVVPPAGGAGCAGPAGLGWELDDGEITYLDGLLAAYDRAQRAAVATLAREGARVRFVDLRTPSTGHDLCAGPRAWVNAPILAGLGFAGDSLHPSSGGMDAIAGVVEAFARATGLGPRGR